MSLPKPDFDTTPFNVISVTDEDRLPMLEAAEAILQDFIDGKAVTPSAIALAHMVKDYLG